MANRGKHHIFSARTTEEGLRLLNELKGKLGVSWDEMIIGAVSAYYSLDKDILMLPKQEKPKAPKTKPAKTPKAEAKTKGKPKKYKAKPKPKRVEPIEAKANVA